MKKTHLLQILLFIPFFSYAQNQSGISIGIKALEYADFSKLLNESRGSKYSPQLLTFNGLSAKFNDNEFSFRIQVSRLKKDDYSLYNNCQTCEIVNGDYKGTEVKIGFEKNLSAGYFQPFFGTDIGYRNVSFQGKATSYDTNTFLYNVDIDQNGALISPFIGIKGNFFNSRITISAETGLEAVFNYEKETKFNQANEIISQDKYNRNRFNTRPLGTLSIMYNFNYQ